MIGGQRALERIGGGLQLLALILGDDALLYQLGVALGLGLRILLLRGIASPIGLRLTDLRLIFGQLSLGQLELPSKGRESISARRSPALTNCPS